MSAVDSQITSLAVVYSTVYLGTDQINIKAPCHWPLCGEFTGDRWILRTKGQLRGKCFHLMTSSWFGHLPLQHHDTISGPDNVSSKQHTHWSIQPAWCPYTIWVVIASPGSGHECSCNDMCYYECHRVTFYTSVFSLWFKTIWACNGKWYISFYSSLFLCDFHYSTKHLQIFQKAFNVLNSAL